MKFSPEDPKLTAYVLGELPEVEAREIEHEALHSPELRQALDEIRETANLLQSGLAAEPALRLSPAEKEQLVAKAEKNKVVHRPHRSFWRTAGISAIAASVVCVVAWQLWNTEKEPQSYAAAERESIKPAQDIAATPAAPSPQAVPVPEAEPVAVDATSPAINVRVGGTQTRTPAKTVNYDFAKGSDGNTPNFSTVYNGGQSAAVQWDDSELVVSPEEIKRGEAELDTLRRRYTDQHVLVKQQKDKVQNLYARYRHNAAEYPKYVENNFEPALQNPLSTFSIDVDTASYANVRRFLNEGRMPPRDAVRIEEMINYFSYDYPQPRGEEPFSVNMEVAGCPWQPEHRLLRIGLKGRDVAQDKRPPSNFVFLIDVSGSMEPNERLPLIKQALRMLVKRMTEKDRIAIVVYASSSGVVLESTSCVNKEKVLEALDRLEAGGSTNGGQGIQRAYKLAEEHFIKGGVNRVILCTDGDFNVGITDQSELISLIERKARSGVFLSALGVGDDNYKDALLQRLADKGNGNYHYIDTMEEAHKVLVQQMNGTLMTIAKDVKIQIEFNPARVSSYRLIGYEKRLLEAADFNNDRKDAGEIGAGHTVTALYEIVPAGISVASAGTRIDELKYQKPAGEPAKRHIVDNTGELLTLKLRYKKPDGENSVLREHTLTDSGKNFSQTSTDFRFAAAVASFGMILKDSEHKGRANLGGVLEIAKEAKGGDKEGYRAEFINLVNKAKSTKR